MLQPITSLAVSKSLVDKLQQKGYQNLEDVPRKYISSLHLPTRKFTFKSALDYWQAEINNSSIPTISIALDAALGDGIKLGAVTEFCGLPGSGKTQLCLQLCISVQIPTAFGGLGGEAVYIDTASNFTTSRLKDLFNAYQKCRDESHPNFSSEKEILRGVHYIESFGILKFCAALHLLHDLLFENPKIKLIIIDCLPFPFKTECSDIDRTGILCRQITALRKIAREKNIAVVITNEMSTRIGIGIVGALGDVWAHCTGTRLVLAPPHIIVSHNSEKPDSVVQIEMSKNGIRDVQ